jgi:hypothetical protein
MIFCRGQTEFLANGIRNIEINVGAVMSDLSFVIGNPIDDEYPVAVRLSAEKNGASVDEAWVDYCHEFLSGFVESNDENSLNTILSLALGKNVIAPKTFLTFRVNTANDQNINSPVLMLLSTFCTEQLTGDQIHITNAAAEKVSIYIRQALNAEYIEVVLATEIDDDAVFSDADEWRYQLFQENSRDCYSAFNKAVESGNGNPVVFLIDVRDRVGGVLAKSLNGGQDINEFNTYIGTA